MPNIKDQSTVEAIAREYCDNGRNKLEALKTIGYKPSYYNTLGIGRVYSNIRVIDAIGRIDAETRKDSRTTRELRQSFWRKTYKDTKVNMADRLRASELDGRSEADFTDNIQRTNKTLSNNVMQRLDDKEL